MDSFFSPQAFDIVRIPFPFADSPEKVKYRPALVISDAVCFGTPIKHSVVLMITSAKQSSFPLDVPIFHYQGTGLPQACIIRMKFFTVDNALITNIVGMLSHEDKKEVKENLIKLFGL